MSTRIDAVGVAIEIPSGWEAEIDHGGGDPSLVDGGQGGVVTVAMPRVHVANFALPRERGDFGSGAVERMRSGDVFICILEEDPAMASTTLYGADEVPTFTVDDFHPDRMQRPIAGQSGAQAFFHVGDRAFVVYVVVGDHQRRAGAVAPVNSILSTLDLG